VYQRLMIYWAETMQDDVYALVSDGWQTGTEIERQEKKKEWEGRLIPKELIIARYFPQEQKVIESLEAHHDALVQQRQELEEEHSGEEGLIEDAKNEKDKLTKISVQKRLKEIKKDEEFADERKVLEEYLKLTEQEADASRKIKEAQSALEKKVLDKYKTLTEAEIKTLVVEDKWMAVFEKDVRTEMERISQRLTGRIKELAERYETPLPALNAEVDTLEEKVHAHLRKMGFVWK